MGQAEVTADDAAAINEVLRAMADAWARGDGAGYAAAFTDDARYVTMSGRRCVGRQVIAESHQQIFDSVFRGSRLAVDDPVRLQPVTPDVVLVHGSATVSFPGERTAGVRPAGLLTIVAVRDGDAWRFASFSNTPAAREP